MRGNTKVGRKTRRDRPQSERLLRRKNIPLLCAFAEIELFNACMLVYLFACIQLYANTKIRQCDEASNHVYNCAFKRIFVNGKEESFLSCQRSAMIRLPWYADMILLCWCLYDTCWSQNCMSHILNIAFGIIILTQPEKRHTHTWYGTTKYTERTF